MHRLLEVGGHAQHLRRTKTSSRTEVRGCGGRRRRTWRSNATSTGTTAAGMVVALFVAVRSALARDVIVRALSARSTTALLWSISGSSGDRFSKTTPLEELNFWGRGRATGLLDTKPGKLGTDILRQRTKGCLEFTHRPCFHTSTRAAFPPSWLHARRALAPRSLKPPAVKQYLHPIPGAAC